MRRKRLRCASDFHKFSIFNFQSSLPVYPGSALYAFNIRAQLGDLKTQPDTLLTGHADVGIFKFEVSLQMMTILFQIHNPGFIFFVVINLDIDTTFSDIGKYLSYLLTQLFCVIFHAVLLSRRFAFGIPSKKDD